MQSNYTTNPKKKSKLPTYFVDGGTSRNGREGQNSIICGTNAKGEELFFENVGNKTNNEAELLAIIRILQKTEGDIQIISDSQLAVNLVQHKYHTKIDRLRVLLKQVQSFQRIFKIVWKPREKNKAGWLIENSLGL